MLLLKVLIFIFEIIITIQSVKSTSQTYNNEPKNVGVRLTFLTKWTIQTINDIATYGKCLRKCTINGDCESGEYDLSLKKCRLLSRMPTDADLIVKQNAVTFFKGIY
jgi:hypothetical protein